MKSTWPTPAPHVGDATPPIFHLLALGVGMGGNANFSVRVGGNANCSVFRYQHVGIPKEKLWRWGSNPTRGSNANGFASPWNIGLKGTNTQHSGHTDQIFQTELMVEICYKNLVRADGEVLLMKCS